MSFKMIYDERNRQNIAKLADNTKVATLKWYQYCIDNGIQILIYETIRSVETQRQNVAKGASQTMKSYHLVGQALDFVPVNDKGTALWNGYNSKDIKKAFDYARKLGFECGHDWGWDSPHLQYNYKGYGTDTFGKIKVDMKVTNKKSTIDKEISDMDFTSPTLKTKLEERLNSPATAKLLDETAQKVLGYKTKLKNGKMEDGDLLAIAIELAVELSKKSK